MSSDAQPKHDHGPRRLSGEDSVFVQAESPSMPMHTLGVLILDAATAPGGSFDRARIVRHVKARIHLLPPFRQRLVEAPFGLGRPVLADDPDFRVEHHVHRTLVPRPGTPHELAKVVGRIAGRLLDRSRPLWEMWLVEGLEGGRVALVAKMHHCLIDGASGASQMASLLDFAPDAEAPPPAAFHPDPLPSPLGLLSRELLRPPTSPLRLAQLLVKTATGIVRRRRVGVELELARGGSPPPLLPNAPRTCFSRAITPSRSVAFGSAALDDVKLVKSAFGVTVNDAVLAACAMAVRRYLEAHDDLPAEPIVCAVPVSLKSGDELREASNKVSVMLVRLPTHVEDPQDVVEAVRRETDAAKRVFGAIEDDLAVGWLELAPGPLVAVGSWAVSTLKLADWVTMPMSCVVSNMRGAPIPLYFAGARVLATYPLGPLGEGIGANITVLSNMGRLDFGVIACRDTVPGVWELADGFAAAVAELKAVAERRIAAGASPWTIGDSATPGGGRDGRR